MRCPCGSLRTRWNGRDKLWECSNSGTAYPPPQEKLLATLDDEEAGLDLGGKKFEGWP